MSKSKELEPAEDYGPAMAECLPKERALIEHLFQGKSGAEAARLAGYGAEDGSSKPETMARIAHRTLHRDRVQLAMVEYVKKAARSLGAAAIKAQTEILADFTHKDRAKIALAVMERIDPVVQKIDAHHTHEVIDRRTDLLSALRTAKEFGATKEKLEELFGYSALPELERQLALQDAKQPIDAEFTEIDLEREAMEL